MSQKQIDMAINHYIEAKVYQKAIEAALSARQFTKALQLVDAIDSEGNSARPYYKQLARHYDESRQYDLAERCYIAAGTCAVLSISISCLIVSHHLSSYIIIYHYKHVFRPTTYTYIYNPLPFFFFFFSLPLTTDLSQTILYRMCRSASDGG